MDRKDFIKTLALIPIGGLTMQLSSLKSITDKFERTSRMPVLFLGHGSPMNAIEENDYTRKFREIGKSLPKPRAVLCVSAHWETNGTFVTAMPKPQTIHDFGGFPKALNEFQYPAMGSPEFALQTKEIIHSVDVGLDQEWGLDHGCWSVLCHLFPDADVPVYQLSLNYKKDAQWHYELAKELSALRDKGVLIVGSGNMVHNLRMVSWQTPQGGGYDWAIEANDIFKNLISSNEHQRLIQYQSLGKAVQLAVPSADHYLPLLYTLGLKGEKESVEFFNDRTDMGSISMTSVLIH
ncbi:MAG: Extradiol ring-cleavage dioxygenase, class enzyme subunit [Chitinophagaceae bacterium]|nr:Extradiol ring-cleavage dioxygenase, class enzyme subunit [Chitinophagaceae bacterium]